MSRNPNPIGALLDLADAARAAEAKIAQAGNLNVVLSEQCAKLDALRKDCIDAEDEAARIRSETAAHRRQVEASADLILTAANETATRTLSEAGDEAEKIAASWRVKIDDLKSRSDLLAAECDALEGEKAVLENKVASLRADVESLRTKLASF